jgi:phage shock protein A
VGLFSRIWRIIKGWLLIGVERAEDPEVILTEAKEAMERELAKAKEAAVQAIGQRNLLRGMLADQEKKLRELDAQARAALKAGDEALARQLLVEKANIQKTVESLNLQLAKAEESSVSVKESIKALEAQVRQRAAERLALIAGWKQAQIQESLNKALSGIDMGSHSQAFEKASDKIKELQAKADARVEIASTDLNSRVAQLQTTVASQEAEDELQALKAEMGLLPPAQAATSQTTTQTTTQATEQQEEQKVRNIEV